MLLEHSIRRSATCALALVGLMLFCSCAQSSRQPAKEVEHVTIRESPRQILIITGEDYAGHKWQDTTPVLQQAIGQDPLLIVHVLDDLKSLAARDLSQYAAIVLHFKNYDPAVPGKEGFNNIKNFVDDGGGLVLVHFACGAFEEFREDFEQLAGRAWFGIDPPPGKHQHDPYGSFMVELSDTRHQITEGMTSFETTDELYTCLMGDKSIEVLATAQSVRDGNTYPIAFVVPHDQGRIFHCVLGHDVAALSNEHVGNLFKRGTSWAAGF